MKDFHITSINIWVKFTEIVGICIILSALLRLPTEETVTRFLLINAIGVLLYTMIVSLYYLTKDKVIK